MSTPAAPTKKMTPLDRILLLLTALLAAYQVVAGVEGMNTLAVTSYTVAFGVLLVAGLLLIILGFEILDSPVVVIISTIIPLALSLGLIADRAQQWTNGFLLFTIAGFLAVTITRYAAPKRLAVLTLMLVHGASGLTIFGLPLALAFSGQAAIGFALVGLGGGLIGLGGLLLSFLKTGHPILSRAAILALFPALLLLTAAAFVAGFALG